MSSLKVRLTLLYTIILGFILLLFSIAVYFIAILTLKAQVDESLGRNANFIIERVQANKQNQFRVVTDFNIELNMYYQIWGANGKLYDNSLNLDGFHQPLDLRAYQTDTSLYRDVELEGAYLRVLSVPLNMNNRRWGVLQVARDMEVVDGTSRDLIEMLIITYFVTLLVAAIFTWVSAQRILAPLGVVTSIARQITGTNDLSRRIPEFGYPGDEVHNLVHSFNMILTSLDEIIHSQRQFLADVGHELRTPLTVIKGNVALMRRAQEPDEESLGSIEDEVARLTRLVGDLLLLAQAESGKLPLYREAVELDSVLFEVFREVKVLAKSHVALNIKEIDQVLVCGDRDRLKQVLINLVSNGIKYTPHGGKVEISLSKTDSQAIFSVADNGPGIPKEDIPHIFERFYRAEKSRARSQDGKGFGLGLSIVYWIVHNHEGEIVRKVIGPNSRDTLDAILTELTDTARGIATAPSS